MFSTRRVGVCLLGFARRHKQSEEAAAEAVTADVVWALVKRAGIFAAGVAAASTIAVTTQSGPTYHPGFSLSVKGAAFITRNEGVRYSPYNDPYNCTVGVGHLIHMGVCTTTDYATWKLTPAQATSLLLHDSSTAVSYVRQSVTRKITQPQFDALVDFTFNVGGGGLEQSSALGDVNTGDFAAVPAALALWDSANGVVLHALVVRRQAEGVLFTTGNYGVGIGTYTPPKPVPTKVANLRAKSGYWSWLSWRLGEDAWKPYGPRRALVRPNVPRTVPARWWRRYRVFVAHRSGR